ncbi:MAG: polysaccharide deacetylase family protein [Spirochaetales bacterium]|nr:polysaccharide deacetylase family protein [Spirochaetales bacterium]
MKRNAMIPPLAPALLLLALASAPLHAEVSFGGLDLAEDGRLLYTATIDLPGSASFRTLFMAELGSGETTQLSFYPEHVELVDDGRTLQVQNRLGVYRTGADLSELKAVAGFPSFARGAPPQSGKLLASSPSPDGKWLLYLAPVSAAYGNLMLLDVASGKSTAVAERVGFSVEEFPASWSPGSDAFVYARDGNIHYYSIEQHRAGRVIEEAYRLLGDGRMEALRWGADGYLYMVKNRSVYRIMPAEFFTQALYAGLVTIGTMVGSMPFPFDPNFDSFWISPDGLKILLCKGGRNLFLYYLDPDDYGREARINALPYLFLQGDTTIRTVLWPESDQVTIFTSSLDSGKRVSAAYRVSAPAGPGDLGLSPSFRKLETGSAVSISMSPDATKVALAGSDGVIVRKYSDWTLSATISAPGTLHAIWLDDRELVVAGDRSIELVPVAGGARRLIGVSQADRHGWSAASAGAVAVEAAGVAWERAPGSALWTRAPAYAARTPSAGSAAWRVYLDELDSGSYRNVVMVRSIKGLGTRSLIAKPETGWDPFPASEETPAGLAFEHGSRIRRREVALVFNAYDDPTGLAGVLDTLAEFGIRATFFLNGEFIRRNPGATRMIAESGHEVGNMFFSTYDPTDARFRVDGEFVQRGLARTEDEYFAATGKDLSLLWHTPWYSTSTVTLEAAEGMNYRYIGRDVDPLDWVPATEKLAPGLYLDAPEIVERVVERKKPGSIIPIRIGVPPGGRDDYLFAELSLLLNALLKEGYEIVPVSTLVEHAE